MNRLFTLGIAAGSILVSACASSSQGPRHVAASSGCDQLTDAQATLGAFYAPGGVHAAKKVDERVFLARAIQPRRTMGADLYVHAQPNVQPEYLQRVLTCHAARGQAAHPSDPLHPSEGSVAEVRVRSAGTGFAVRILGEDSKTGREIWQKAQDMTAPSSVTVEQVADASSGENGRF